MRPRARLPDDCFSPVRLLPGPGPGPPPPLNEQSFLDPRQLSASLPPSGPLPVVMLLFIEEGSWRSVEDLEEVEPSTDLGSESSWYPVLTNVSECRMLLRLEITSPFNLFLRQLYLTWH